MNKDLRIVFMGTPEFAVASLRKLVEAKKNIVGVITAPDKAAGRGLKFHQSAVKQFALQNNLNVMQPTKLKDENFLNELRNLKADLQIVVAFRMLPEVVWNMPPLGTFNLHASLLPQYRGAAPINWAVINGETETGNTTFFLQHEIDTGKIIFNQKEKILPDDNAGTLHDKLMMRGADLVLKTVEAIESGSYPQMDQQTDMQLKHAPKIFTDDCRLNWNQTVTELHNRVRGLSPYPGAFTLMDNKVMKIYLSEVELCQPVEQPGTFVTDGKIFLKVACINGYLKLLEVQPESKRRMMIADYIRGHKH